MRLVLQIVGRRPAHEVLELVRRQDREVPVLGQQHIYAGDTTLMGAILLSRILLFDTDGSQRREEHPYHEEATASGDQRCWVPGGLRARRELHQADN